MAIITEEPESPKPRLRKSKAKPKSQLESTSSPPSPPPPPVAARTTTAANPFQFWFFSTLVVSLITLFIVLLSYLSPQDPKTWFLNLPPILRAHYSNGRTIKVQTAPNLPQIELFSIQQGHTNSLANVLIVHGLGCSSFAFRRVVASLGDRNVHAVAIDLPGSGFSDKTLAVTEEYAGGSGVFGELWDVFEDIKEKGLFWGFDQLVEQGYVDVEENRVRAQKKRIVEKPVEFGSEEMGKVLTQVIDSMGMSPVDLVLHDSALVLSAGWILENRALIRSLVVLDGGLSGGTAFPVWALGLPVVREFVLGSRLVFERVVASYCMKPAGGPEVDAHRILLKGRDGVKAVVGMRRNLNFSFDLFEWGGRDELKDLPLRVLWSDDERAELGRMMFVNALPMASFVTLSGADKSEEVANNIFEFVSYLPKVAKLVSSVETPNDVEERVGHDHGSHHHAHAGYMDAYGDLDHGWGA